jgi:hypothetical protein
VTKEAFDGCTGNTQAVLIDPLARELYVGLPILRVDTKVPAPLRVNCCAQCTDLVLFYQAAQTRVFAQKLD